MKTDPSLEDRIAHWRSHLEQQASLRHAESDELEDHLRTQIEALLAAGLSEEEAFLVAIKRMGDTESLSREFAREYSERLWKQLLPSASSGSTANWLTRDTMVAMGFAVLAALAMKLPNWFGLPFDESPATESFYVRNVSLLILPFLAAYFAWKRGLNAQIQAKVAAPFVVAAMVMNLFPFVPQGSTELLSAIHLPILLWFILGLAYMDGRWTSHPQRMNFVRFSGEWFIYLALIAFGGGVLMVFTMLLFESIGLDAESFVQSWLLPCGIAGAMVVSGWLVEAKQSIIENMAPVLTRLFTPLFALLLLSFIVVMITSGSGIQVERDVLIGYDLLLVLILGLLLYTISARDPETPPNLFDYVQFIMVVSALLVDILALWAIAMRISEFGWSPNKIAALGENIILLVNLGWSAVLYARFLLRRERFTAVERWQTRYIPVYPVWAAVVVVVFPLLFGFR